MSANKPSSSPSSYLDHVWRQQFAENCTTETAHAWLATVKKALANNASLLFLERTELVRAAYLSADNRVFRDAFGGEEHGPVNRVIADIRLHKEFFHSMLVELWFGSQEQQRTAFSALANYVKILTREEAEPYKNSIVLTYELGCDLVTDRNDPLLEKLVQLCISIGRHGSISHLHNEPVVGTAWVDLGYHMSRMKRVHETMLGGVRDTLASTPALLTLKILEPLLAEMVYPATLGDGDGLAQAVFAPSGKTAPVYDALRILLPDYTPHWDAHELLGSTVDAAYQSARQVTSQRALGVTSDLPGILPHNAI